MRDILFRGKRKDNGEWVYGSLLIMNINGRTCSLIVGSGFSLVGNTAESNNRAPLVDPETVGQYTGLTDKNGKRIFEGNILRVVSCEYSYTTSVGAKYGYENGFYVDGDFGDGDYTVLDWAVDYWQDDGAEIEIIGNIHDNPELLGGADNETD